MRGGAEIKLKTHAATEISSTAAPAPAADDLSSWVGRYKASKATKVIAQACGLKPDTVTGTLLY
jgi:hypothetical protein